MCKDAVEAMQRDSAHVVRRERAIHSVPARRYADELHQLIHCAHDCVQRGFGVRNTHHATHTLTPFTHMSLVYSVAT